MGFGGPPFFGNDDLSLGQAMFMAEEEGVDDLVTTHKARFNAALNEIKDELGWTKGNDFYDATYEVNMILQKHHILPTELTKAEVKRIQKTLE